MKNNNYLKELQNNQPLKVEYLKTWLTENENYFYFLINESNCGKWSKWVKDKSILLFPCCCPIREQDCIFIETYYTLEKIVELHNKEDYFKAIIQDYKIIENSTEQVLEWYKKYQNLSYKIAYSTEISIKLELEPYITVTLKIVEDEFENVMEFKRIIHKIYLEQDDEN